MRNLNNLHRYDTLYVASDQLACTTKQSYACILKTQTQPHLSPVPACDAQQSCANQTTRAPRLCLLRPINRIVEHNHHIQRVLDKHLWICTRILIAGSGRKIGDYLPDA